MDPHSTDDLLEEALSAWRPRSPEGEILPHPAWADLDASARERLFDETLRARRLEAALNPDSLSSTARAVLDGSSRRSEPSDYLLSRARATERPALVNQGPAS